MCDFYPFKPLANNNLPIQRVITSLYPNIRTISVIKPSNLQSISIKKYFPNRISIRQKRIQIAIHKGIKRLPRNSNTNILHKIIKLILIILIIAFEREIPSEPNNFANTSVNYRHLNTKCFIYLLFKRLTTARKIKEFLTPS